MSFSKNKAFVEEQRKVQEQQATIAKLESDSSKQEATIGELKKGMEIVVAHAKEQDSQIQKLSARVKINRPAARVVLGNQ
jgi:uncharacterized coiled-coil protein SlyX